MDDANEKIPRSEITAKYHEVVDSELLVIESQIEALLISFEDKYQCSIGLSEVTSSEVRQQRKHLHLKKSTLGAHSYNQGVRLLGLSLEDYPPELTS